MKRPVITSGFCKKAQEGKSGFHCKRESDLLQNQLFELITFFFDNKTFNTATSNLFIEMKVNLLNLNIKLDLKKCLFKTKPRGFCIWSLIRCVCLSLRGHVDPNIVAKGPIAKA